MAEQVRASHILLMYAGSMRSTASRSKDDAQREIQEIQTKLAKGGDFAALATQHSQDEGSAQHRRACIPPLS